MVTAGGSQLCIWDLLSGGKLLQRLTNFQKTVTCVRLSPLAGPESAAAPRLLAGSLDGHVKIFELDSFKVCGGGDLGGWRGLGGIGGGWRALGGVGGWAGGDGGLWGWGRDTFKVRKGGIGGRWGVGGWGEVGRWGEWGAAWGLRG